MAKDQIFYSWQSDIRAAANRTLIEDALDRAISRLSAREIPSVEPAIDRDTLGTPGSPDIASTILDKIDQAAMFVADVTLVDANPTASRRFPNPNVLLEIGYAMKSLGFSKIVLVQNTYFGPVEALPFDLRGRKIITYSSDPEDSERSRIRDGLSKRLLDEMIRILGVESYSLEESSDLDVVSIRNEIDDAFNDRTGGLEARVEAIVERIDTAELSAIDYSGLLERIIAFGQKSLSPEFVLNLCEKSISAEPKSVSYFYKGLAAGQLGLPYDSIAGYMKAIDAGDPNPSLCFLNAGNRYRELNDLDIAISFYEKSVALNASQETAWRAAAHLHDQKGNTDQAVLCHAGFLKWYESAGPTVMAARAQEAKLAREYIKEHGAQGSDI